MKKFLMLFACGIVAAMLWGCGSDNSTAPPPADPQGAATEVALGNTDLGNGNYAGANQHYQAALTKDPNNNQARLGVAVTDVYLLQNDTEVQSVVDYLDQVPPPVVGNARVMLHSKRVASLLDPAHRSFTPVSEGRAVMRMLTAAVTNPPAISDIQRIIVTKVMPKLQSTQNHLNVIEQASEFVFKLPPAATGLADTLEIDKSDVLLLDSVVNGVQGWLGLVVAYNFDVSNNDFDNVNTDSLLTPGTDWAKLHDGGALALAAAKENLLLVKTRLDQAALSLAGEADDQTDDLVPKTWLDTPEYQDLQDGVTRATNTLAGPVAITVNDYAGQPFAMGLNLGRFFVPAITDLKTKLPDHTFDVYGKPQLVAPITFPDPTINGIFPDMTDARWQQLTGVTGPVARATR